MSSPWDGVTLQGEMLLQKGHPTDKSAAHCLCAVLGLGFFGYSVAWCAVGRPGWQVLVHRSLGACLQMKLYFSAG